MVRPGTEADIPAIVALLESMQAESWYGYLPAEPEKFRAVVNALLEKGCVLVSEHEGTVEGFFLGAIVQFWFGTKTFATDLGLFVRPGKRGGISAARMVKGFVEWAKAQGLTTEVQLGISTGVAKESTGRLYERLGFTHVGGNYKRRL